MIEIIVKSLFNFYGLILFILILNIFNSRLKVLNLFFIFFFLLISIVYFQNFILKKFSYFSNQIVSIDDNKKYDLLILGGNEIKRNMVAIDVLDKYNIGKVLYVNDKNQLNTFFLKNLAKRKKIIISEKSNSTYEDIKFLIKNLNDLNENIIIITDDFHINRVSMLVSEINKNFFYAPVKNYNDFDHNKLIDFNRGIYYLEIIMREIASITLYYFKYI
ncbi:YdcF family protein [Pelagibacterales bacterium SAG-MED31]|nr:YdcF family protein [Pelagibacterales bacterium SAG-MED31]